ncbi:hypothetical protein [Bordetella genomosp. 1]|uniref:Chemotaxis protein n=1 Tax=Bordetella genomosp. 1 TaxID=1395607 RepID=A0ABX4EW45_9BORD|nr:hypothetical protein [Bordetella genomosp. 1]OZI58700.1 hypothetical protein CAL27_18635 [Bordetella genomosp. 1]
MDRPILAALDRARASNPWTFAALEGWLLVLLMVGGGAGIGYSLAGVRSDYLMAEQAIAHTAEVQRMQVMNQQLLSIIQDRLPEITTSAAQAAEKVERAADAAQGAIKAAKGAASKAGTAATKASAAAKSANTAVQKVEEALSPPPPSSATVPDWLDTP